MFFFASIYMYINVLAWIKSVMQVKMQFKNYVFASEMLCNVWHFGGTTCKLKDKYWSIRLSNMQNGVFEKEMELVYSTWV